MNVTTFNKKLELIQWLSTIEDEFLIEQLSFIREAQSGDWWNSASELENESVMKGLADAEMEN